MYIVERSVYVYPSNKFNFLLCQQMAELSSILKSVLKFDEETCFIKNLSILLYPNYIIYLLFILRIGFE